VTEEAWREGKRSREEGLLANKERRTEGGLLQQESQQCENEKREYITGL